MVYCLTIHQPHCSPSEDAYLIAGSSNLKSFPLCAYAMALVDVVDALAIPYTAVAFVGSYGFDSLFSGATLDAFGSDLITALVSDGFAAFEGETVVISEFANCANVNHMYYLPFLVYLIIPYYNRFVKWFWKNNLFVFRRSTSKWETASYDAEFSNASK